MRFLMTVTAGQEPDEKMMTEMGQLVEELTKAGVLLATGGLDPVGTRVSAVDGKVTVTDGPFTEAKEAIISFALLIRRGFAALLRARRLGQPAGPYVLQAAIAACHARARCGDETEWEQIAALYELLGQVMPSPVVELNRAVAVGMAFGPARGLELADALTSRPELRNYHLLPSVRADFLAKLGRREESSAEFTRAASLTGNAAERAVLTERAAACSPRNP